MRALSQARWVKKHNGVRDQHILAGAGVAACAGQHNKASGYSGPELLSQLGGIRKEGLRGYTKRERPRP